MRIVVLVLALLPGAAFAGEGPRQTSRPYAAPAHCKSAALEQTRRNRAPARVEPLNKQPRAEQYFTVLRLENGCDKPIKVRDRRR